MRTDTQPKTVPSVNRMNDQKLNRLVDRMAARSSLAECLTVFLERKKERKKERKNYALGRELRKGMVRRQACPHTLPQFLDIMEYEGVDSIQWPGFFQSCVGSAV